MLQNASWTVLLFLMVQGGLGIARQYAALCQSIIGKDRDPLIRDPLCLSLSSVIEAILSLTDSYISLSSLTKAIICYNMRYM